MSSDANVYAGRCFCGAVELTVTGEPMVMGYCHCADCRAWFASPVNAFTIWPPEAVRVTRGAENVGSYRKTETSGRKRGTACGGPPPAGDPAAGGPPRPQGCRDRRQLPEDRAQRPQVVHGLRRPPALGAPDLGRDRRRRG